MGVSVIKNIFKKHKTHIIYSINLKGKKILCIIMIFIFNVSFILTIKNIEKNFKPTVEALAVSLANIYALETIDKSIEEISKYNKDYDELCNINKNDTGDIISITTNTVAINKVKLDLSNKIIENLKNPHVKELGIPIGNLTKTYILSGRGPEIPIKILTASSPDLHIKSSFESAGVNQTKHKLSVFANINIIIILPYESINKKVSYETILAETIIVGKVPDVYVSK